MLGVFPCLNYNFFANDKLWEAFFVDKNISTLDRVSSGCTARVKQLLSTGSMRRRLLDIGLIEGTQVKCLHKSPAGDPVAYLIRGSVIALRSEDSSKIVVETH